MMKNNGNFLFGLILIVVGGFWIAGTCGLIHFSFIYLLFRFWPVLLILAGLNMIFQGNKGVMLLSVLLLFAGGLYCVQHDIGGVKYCDGKHEGYYRHGGGDHCRTEDFYDLSSIETGKLKLNLGAGDIDVKASDDKRMLFSVPSRNMSRTFNTDDEAATISFQNDRGFNLGGFGQSQESVVYDFDLPQDVLWNIDVDAGAADLELDFSKLMVEKVKIDAGASDCLLILGDQLAYMYVDIDTGVGELNLMIKEGIGVRVAADQVLSDNNFEAVGMTKVGDYYETKDYDQATAQVELSLDAAVSDISVEFYTPNI